MLKFKHMKSLLFILACFYGAGILSGSELPSKSAEAKSNETAAAEAQKITKLSYEGVSRAYDSEVFFYSSLSDHKNSGELTGADRTELRPKLGDNSFFLHRFTARDAKKNGFEIFISE